MRLAAMIAALALAACGPSTRDSDDVADPNARTSLHGAIVAYGEGWQLTADPELGVFFRAHDGAEATGPYSPPRMSVSTYVLDAGDIRATFSEEPCEFDGAAFPMRSIVVTGDNTYLGCSALRWDHQLIALMPQIDACIAEAQGARWVTYAGAHEGMTLVRLSGESGAMDCRTDFSGDERTVDIRPRDESLGVGGENSAIFVRAPGANPGGECYEAPEVRSASGELLGWMMDPEGC